MDRSGDAFQGAFQLDLFSGSMGGRHNISRFIEGLGDLVDNFLVQVGPAIKRGLTGDRIDVLILLRICLLYTSIKVDT